MEVIQTRRQRMQMTRIRSAIEAGHFSEEYNKALERVILGTEDLADIISEASEYGEDWESVDRVIGDFAVERDRYLGRYSSQEIASVAKCHGVSVEMLELFVVDYALRAGWQFLWRGEWTLEDGIYALEKYHHIKLSAFAKILSNLPASAFTTIANFLDYDEPNRIDGMDVTTGPRHYKEYFYLRPEIKDEESARKAMKLFVAISRAEGLNEIPAVKIVEVFTTARGNRNRKNILGRYWGKLKDGFVELPSYSYMDWTDNPKKNYRDGHNAGKTLGIDRWIHTAVHEYYHWFTGLKDTMKFSSGLADFVEKHKEILIEHSGNI